VKASNSASSGGFAGDAYKRAVGIVRGSADPSWSLERLVDPTQRVRYALARRAAGDRFVQHG